MSRANWGGGGHKSLLYYLRSHAACSLCINTTERTECGYIIIFKHPLSGCLVQPVWEWCWKHAMWLVTLKEGLLHASAANCWHHLKTKTFFSAWCVELWRTNHFWPIWFLNEDSTYKYSFIPGTIAHQDAAMSVLWTTCCPFPPPAALSVLGGLSISPSDCIGAWQDLMRLGLLALGVLVRTFLKSYQEIYWKHGHFTRCMVQRELVWLPSHWGFQQPPPFALLVKSYEDFLLCPHSPGHRYSPGILHSLLVHQRDVTGA